MATLTMLDRMQAPRTAAKAAKALAVATKAAGTVAPGAWAFYLGGPGHNGGKGSTYSNDLLDDMQAKGIPLLPIYVGRQHSLSRKRGVADAKDAMRLHKSFGRRGDVIVTDIEKHTSEADPAAAVEYVSAWTETLHQAGLRAMVYGDFNLANSLAKHADPKPDAVWVARFRSHAPQPTRNPHRIPDIPATAFGKPGQRAWQYGGEFKDHKGDKEPTPCTIEKMNVDISAIDAEVFGKAVPAPARAAKPAATAVSRPVAAAKRTHVIASGETLSELEVRFHLPFGSLFKANKAVLDAEAKRRGLASSENGNKVFPGTTVTIPG